MSPRQRACLKYLADKGDWIDAETMSDEHRSDLTNATRRTSRRILIERELVERRSEPDAHQRNGLRWSYRITEAGKAALEAP